MNQTLPQAADRKAALLNRHDTHVSAALVDAADEAAAGGRQHQINARRRAQLAFDREHRALHRLKARAFARRDINVELRFVHITRLVILVDDAIERHRRKDYQQRQHGNGDAVAHGEAEHDHIKAVNKAIKSAARFRLIVMAMPCGVFGLQQPRAHHRRQGERNHQADENCRRRRNPELIKEAARNARHERHRHKDDDQTERRRHDGQADLGSRGARRFKGPHLLFFDVAEDVFQNHDGVIDNDADHQHQRQHRDAVQGEVQCPHHAERSDYGCRDGDAGNQRRAPATHEKHHYQTGEDAAEDEVQVDLVQRRVDVTRLVADDFELDICGQLRGDARERRLDAFDDFNCVGARLPADFQRHRRHAVQARQRALLFSAVFGPANVAHAHRRAVDAGDDQIAEALRVNDAAHGA